MNWCLVLRRTFLDQTMLLIFLSSGVPSVACGLLFSSLNFLTQISGVMTLVNI